MLLILNSFNNGNDANVKVFSLPFSEDILVNDGKFARFKLVMGFLSMLMFARTG